MKSNPVEIRAEIVETDDGDIMMRLKDLEVSQIRFNRGSGQSGNKRTRS